MAHVGRLPSRPVTGPIAGPLRLGGIQALRAEIATLRACQPYPSWAHLGAFYGVPKGTLWRIAQTDYEPKDRAIRLRLGLPTRLPAAWVTCECGNEYAPNVPWRKRCYVCSPPRK